MMPSNSNLRPYTGVAAIAPADPAREAPRRAAADG